MPWLYSENTHLFPNVFKQLKLIYQHVWYIAFWNKTSCLEGWWNFFGAYCNPWNWYLQLWQRKYAVFYLKTTGSSASPLIRGGPLSHFSQWETEGIICRLLSHWMKGTSCCGSNRISREDVVCELWPWGHALLKPVLVTPFFQFLPKYNCL
jgi:hypothetical protein